LDTELISRDDAALKEKLNDLRAIFGDGASALCGQGRNGSDCLTTYSGYPDLACPHNFASSDSIFSREEFDLSNPLTTVTPSLQISQRGSMCGASHSEDAAQSA
jgi:hypothetical protein